MAGGGSNDGNGHSGSGGDPRAAHTLRAEASVLRRLAMARTTQQPTPMPSWSPQPTAMVSYTAIGCGQTMGGTNAGLVSYIGNPSGDAVFLFRATEPAQLKATTCSLKTKIQTLVRLYDRRPSAVHKTLLASETEGYFCSLLYYDAHAAGDYWLVVEGAAASEEGAFELTLTCSEVPTHAPTAVPLPRPSAQPTPAPTHAPTPRPSAAPSGQPSPQPSPDPTAKPSPDPTPQPTPQPSADPTAGPTPQPTPLPSTPFPSGAPSFDPSAHPSAAPSQEPTQAPTQDPTHIPSSLPTSQPTHAPSPLPTLVPSPLPTTCEARRAPSRRARVI